MYRLSLTVVWVVSLIALSACCSDKGEIEKIDAAVGSGDLQTVAKIGRESCSEQARMHVLKLMSEILANPEGAALLDAASAAKILDFWRETWADKSALVAYDKKTGLLSTLNDLCFYGEPNSEKRGVLCRTNWSEDSLFQAAWLNFTSCSGEDCPTSDPAIRKSAADCLLCMSNAEFTVKAEKAISGCRQVEFPFVLAEKVVKAGLSGEAVHDFFASLAQLPIQKLNQSFTIEGNPLFTDDKTVKRPLKLYVLWQLLINYREGITGAILNNYIEKLTDKTNFRQDFHPEEWNNPTLFKSREGIFDPKYRNLIYDAAEDRDCSWVYFALAAYDPKLDRAALRKALQSVNACGDPARYYASLITCRAKKPISKDYLPPYDLDELLGGLNATKFSCLNNKLTRGVYYKALSNTKLDKEKRKLALKSLEKLCAGRAIKKDFCPKVKRLKLDYYFQN